MKKSVLCCVVCSLLLYSCSCNDNKEKENIVYDEIDYTKIKNNFSTRQFSKYVDKHIYASFTPSVGDINLLAVPIAFSDYPVTNEETIKTNIYNSIFGKSEDTGWESVSSYYQKSSFNKLNIKGDITDIYYLNKPTTYYKDITDDKDVIKVTSDIYDEAITYFVENTNLDLSKYDNDNDNYIDGIYFVYLAPYYGYRGNTTIPQTMMFWAFSCSNLNFSNFGLETGAYFWSSYYYLFAGYGDDKIDTHTYVHETGHLLSLTDYYSSSLDSETKKDYKPMGAVDMMDNNVIDHNCYSKFTLGWVEPYLINKPGVITLTPANKSGDCVIIPKESFNNTSTDEYLMLEFYTPENLNYKDSIDGYSPRETVNKIDEIGVRLYHVDARLVYFEDYVPMDGASNSPMELKDYSLLETNNYMINYMNTNTPNGIDKNGEIVSCLNYKLFGDEYDTYYDEFRLICTITPEGINYSKSSTTFSNAGLFKEGDVFSLSDPTYISQFVKTNEEENLVISNTNEKFLYNFKILSLNKDTCKIAFFS